MTRLTVFGDGQVGTRLAELFGTAADGWSVSGTGIGTWRDEVERGVDVAVLSVTHGHEATEVVGALAGARTPPRLIVDLTTQSLSSADHSAALASNVRYAAGGLTGGLGGLHTGAAVLLLGGASLEPDEKQRLAAAGMIIEYPTVRQGVAAKLLHNWYQLASSAALAEAVRAAAGLGMSPGGLIAAIHSGPAGRPVPHHSLIRDWLAQPSTSYQARLVLKDLTPILEMFNTIGNFPAARQLLDDIRRALVLAQPDSPYTAALLAEPPDTLARHSQQ
jgi:3-hydroxyisobutyrate dehydrogenase-like beta-hydroxyacid dehydrogenase